MPIAAAVGKDCTNNPDDVRLVETRLMHHKAWLPAGSEITVDGTCTPKTIEAIRQFQLSACALDESRADAVVSPGGLTIARLERDVIARPRHAVFGTQSYDRRIGKMTRDDFEAAAAKLGCERAAIEAVAMQEVGARGAWDDALRRPTILFERHLFAKHSGNRWNRTHPDISNPDPGGYGTYVSQYRKLARAAVLDEAAALKSASWGAFQILGENFADAGHVSVEAFVEAMLDSERAHLRAFVAFIGASSALKKAIRTRDWTSFARRYNGPDFAKNQYDTRIADHYRRLTGGGG